MFVSVSNEVQPYKRVCVKKEQVDYNILKSILWKEDLLMGCKNKNETKTDGNVKRLFILTLEKSLINGIKFIKETKSKESWHANIMRF